MSEKKVSVKTDGDMFARFDCDGVEVEFTKDGDSPNCPNSWTYGFWIDGNWITGTGEEASLAESVQDIIGSINELLGDITEIRDFLLAYGAFGEKRVDE